ncbi:thiosulfate oxidation carrier protein SoxY [Ectothiorhodospiraceae bacterium BW-2]|nr:thiosulfate oxidation carrier protein SoxY [Ectothiorhodospiraceae bacterium BW-2]
MNRRIFLKGSVAGGTVALAAGAGLITPGQLLAAWPKSAFEAKSVGDALNSAAGSSAFGESSSVIVKAPDIAENGAVVPINVKVEGGNVESISILVEGNNTPLVANFNLAANTQADVSTRIKMGKTSNVMAVAKVDGKLVSAKKEVKVTIGGCGG